MRARSWSAEVERLNLTIAPHLRFRLEWEDAGSRLSGVLIAPGNNGRERSAASPLDGSARGRSRLLAVAACLAECAMQLGLGAQACRRAKAWRGTARPKTP